jgi:hypothetical protein
MAATSRAHEKRMDIGSRYMIWVGTCMCLVNSALMVMLPSLLPGTPNQTPAIVSATIEVNFFCEKNYKSRMVQILLPPRKIYGR